MTGPLFADTLHKLLTMKMKNNILKPAAAIIIVSTVVNSCEFVILTFNLGGHPFVSEETLDFSKVGRYVFMNTVIEIHIYFYIWE